MMVRAVTRQHGWTPSTFEPANVVVEELRRRNTELEALHETAVGLIDGLELGTVLDAIVDRAGLLLGTPHGYLYLVEEGGESLRSEVAKGIFAGTAGYRLERGRGVGGRVLETGRPVVVGCYRTWDHRSRDFDAMDIGAVVGVPLWSGTRLVGVIGLAFVDDVRTFGEAELAVLERFGRLAALALDNAQIYGTLKQELLVRVRAEEDLHQAIAQLRRSETDLQVSREEMIRRLAWAIEFRDVETGRHTERMGRYCSTLARRIGLDEERCELIRVASGLHDIGKIGIPDSVLLKPGELTSEERAIVERHTEIGHSILAGSASPLLELAATIALTHHERVDGAGYPHRLAGDTIPLEGRIAAVADVFDALTSDRPYRPAFGIEESLELMAEGRGTQFDPLVLDLFMDSESDFLLRGDRSPRQALSVVIPDAPGSTRHAGSTLETVPIDLLRAALTSAQAALDSTVGDRPAIDAALAALVASGGRDLLPSVYVVDHDRLWLVSQQGYDKVRDGFSLEQGVIARAARTGESQFVPDVSLDPDFVVAANTVRSEIAVPFGEGLPVAGVLNLESRRMTLPPEAVALVAALARSLGQRAEGMRKGVGLDLKSLARLFVDASSLRGVGPIAEFASRTLGRLLELEAASVCLRREGGGFTVASFWHRPESQLEPLSEDDLEHVAREAELAETTCCILDLEASGIRSEPTGSVGRLIWLPLRVGGQELGALLGRAPQPIRLKQEQVEAATLLAQHAASLLDSSLALRREQRAAITDELTGLLNRRGFRERFGEELERAVRTGRPLAIVVLDCDDLKAINDRGGHELGDAVLQMIGDFLRAEKRLEDVAARLGGDEFGLVIPNATTEHAVEVAERLRRALIERGLESGHPITATFGIAAYPGEGAGLNDLLRAADRAMYQAKADGKNRAMTLASSSQRLFQPAWVSGPS
jgi:diguanylate cyclase (GGDEF)-like protein